MFIHKTIEDRPRNVLRQRVENAIVVSHGVDPFSCPERRQIALNTEESTPCALSTKTKPDSRGLDPATPAAEAKNLLANNLDGDLQFHRVSRTVNSVKNQGGECIEPINPL
jgi:hypothetical protein